jgi:hypothetical protein
VGDDRLPEGAAAAIDRYLDAVDAAVPGLVIGLYVCGSLALGDYRPDRSDIDVVVVVAAAPDAAQRGLIAEVHRTVATRVDGPYLTAAALAGPPEDVGPVAFHVDGRFEVGECHEASPVTWAVLAERAITVRGETPADLGVRSEEGALRAFSAANLRGYWANWARTIVSLLDGTADDDTVEARMLEWGVLGAARVHCAATAGRVISKHDAGRYALDTFGEEWRGIVELALASRALELDEVNVGELRRACAFVRQISSDTPP